MRVPVIMLGSAFGASSATWTVQAGGPPGSAGVDDTDHWVDSNGQILYASNGVSWTVENWESYQNAPSESTVVSTASGNKTAGDIVSNLLNDLGTAISHDSVSNIALALQGKNPGLSAADAARLAQLTQKKSLGATLAGNMPWLILGGVALVAVFIMAGTRKR